MQNNSLRDGYLADAATGHRYGQNGSAWQSCTENGFKGCQESSDLLLAHHEPIAICGMAFRLPGGVYDSESFWDLLVNKKDARMPIPADRFNIDAFYSQRAKSGTIQTEAGYFLQDHDLGSLDTAFFSMTKSELQIMDPQQRLLLEVTRECFENAGEIGWRGKRVGCYVGCFGEDWLDAYAKDTQESGRHRIMGYSDFAISNRVSYEFDLKGPSMTLRTACSSALVGLHEACQALQSGECTAAIVGGTNLIMTPTMSIAMSQQGVLSPEGSCKTFDADADGYARAEAISAVYIKPLQTALRDGNPIRAVIRGSSVNFDGKTSNIATPSAETQEALMRYVYAVAGLDPADTAFVECHGTGTPVGDPIEASAVARVFGSTGVYVGSVKPNVGHSEGASGLTSLIKSVLALERRTIPPNIKFTKANPAIHFDEWGLHVPVEAVQWPSNRHERVSINSFGIGGTNAHVIVDSARAVAPRPVMNHDTKITQLVVLSAQHEASLQEMSANYRDYAVAHPERLRDLAYTLGRRREHLPQRLFGVCKPGKPLSFSQSRTVNQPQKIVFVFTGQGANWPQMGRELLDQNPAFADDIHSMDKYLAKLPHAPSWKISDELRKTSKVSRLHLASFSQPLCTAIQIALLNALRAAGAEGQAVVGHSSGEIAAAYAAGVLTAEEAITVAYYRGYVCESQTRAGAMAAVGLNWSATAPYILPGTLIACDNSPSSVTISGDADAIDATLSLLRSARPGVFTRKLQVDKAYHSSHMLDIGNTYHQLLTGKIQPQRPRISFFSSVTKGLISEASEVSPAYWQANLESPVLFREAVTTLLENLGNDLIFVEVGPHPALAGPIRQILADRKSTASYVPTLQRGIDGQQALLSTFGNLFLHGVEVDFASLMPQGNVLTDLPPYPWNHSASYWNESRITRSWRFRRFPHHELLGSRVVETTDTEPVWRNVLQLDDVPWLRDHKIHSDVVLPFAAYLNMACEAVRQITDVQGGFGLRNSRVTMAMVLQDSKPTEIVTSLRSLRLTEQVVSAWYEFSISSHTGSSWIKHCVGQIQPSTTSIGHAPSLAAYPRRVPSDLWYETMRAVGLNYGPSFSLLNKISTSPRERCAAATTENRRQVDDPPYLIHPTAIDQFLQLISVAVAQGQARKLDTLVLPTSFQEIEIREASSKIDFSVSAWRTQRGEYIGNVVGVDTNGKLVLSMKEVRLLPVRDGPSRELLDTHAMARLVWRPSIDFLDSGSLIGTLPTRQEAMRLIEQLAAVCILEIAKKLDPVTLPAGALGKYCKWIRKQRDALVKGKYPNVSNGPELATLDSEERSVLLRSLDTTIRTWPMGGQTTAAAILALYNNVDAMLHEELDPIAVLFQNDNLSKLYDAMYNIDQSSFLHALGHHKPCMRILEVGAGTGGATQHILNGLLDPDGRASYSRYVFTDISAGFFPAAKERFQYVPNIEYKLLDITRDPLEQGFEASSFDLVIATNVVHVTPSLVNALENIKTLLRPRGYLLLQELCPAGKWVNLIFGVLPGWWNGAEDGRIEEPYVDPKRWEKELLAAGFDGLESVVYDDDDGAARINVLMVARRKAPVPLPKKVAFLCDDAADSIVLELQQTFTDRGYEVQLITLQSALIPDRDVISLLDHRGPFWSTISAGKFEALQQLLSDLGSRGFGLLWVTRPCSVMANDPRYAQILGFARVIRSEMIASFATLEIEKNDLSNPGTLLRVFERFSNRDRNRGEVDSDFEFLFHHGQIFTGRFYPVSYEEEMLQCTQQKKSVRLTVSKYGSLANLQWVGYDVLEPGPEDVEIEMATVGMNFKDVLIAMGIVDSESAGLGVEGAGIVSRVGSLVSDIDVGDRVMCIAFEAFATHVRTSQDLCVKIPENLGFEDAATMLCVYATAIRALCDCARLEKGQSVLIHSACGGVGIAAVQICQMVGAKVFATVGTDEKVYYLMTTFGVPRNRIFSSRNTSFLAGVMRETDGKGVDVVLNSLSGELLHASWQCVAAFGKMIEIGKRDLIGKGLLSMDLFQANRSYAAVDLTSICLERSKEAKSLLERVAEHYRNGLIKPIPVAAQFSAADIQSCFRFMQKGEHIGKIVVNMPDDTATMNARPSLDDFVLDLQASYLLVGGLGGLGRAVSTWMVEKGARSLIYLSPNAGTRASDSDFLTELEDQGCSVQTVAGSVENMEDVQKAIRKANLPIKGILQMSMLLRANEFLKDQTFAQMSYKEWQESVACKIQGMWNLHHALECQDLDFFVMFSSISGIIGNRGQANYAAANTFLDSFVLYRRQAGLPASAIDIGLMEDIGAARDQATLVQQLKAYGNHPIHEQDLLDALQLAIIDSPRALPSLPDASNEPVLRCHQPVLGIRSSLPLGDSKNRVIWKRDARFAFYHNTDSMDQKTDRTVSSALEVLLAEGRTDPTIFLEASSAKCFAREVGVKLMDLLLRPDTEIDINMSLSSLGLDSLVAIEVRNWWMQTFGREISTLDLLGSGSIAELGQKAAEQMHAKHTSLESK